MQYFKGRFGRKLRVGFRHVQHLIECASVIFPLTSPLGMNIIYIESYTGWHDGNCTLRRINQVSALFLSRLTAEKMYCILFMKSTTRMALCHLEAGIPASSVRLLFYFSLDMRGRYKYNKYMKSSLCLRLGNWSPSPCISRMASFFLSRLTPRKIAAIFYSVTAVYERAPFGND